ncbi:hypothetical protein JXA80_05600 [bacterium]|nr:hypothetical protein [candidate division CSSED10-310 bacterium]
MKKLLSVVLMSACVVALAAGPVLADNVNDLLKSADANYEAKKYAKALEDLEWARKEIANLQLQEMKKLLPEVVDGMKGQDGDGGSIFGINAVSREYRSEDGEKSVTITLASGKSSQGGAGLGAIMGMAAAMGAMDASRQSKMIIHQGYKGQWSLDPETKEGMLVFNLNGGSMINIETEGYDDEKVAEQAAKSLDIEKIEAAF